MVGKETVSLVIPCLNEEKGLVTIFETMPSCIDEVVVVDNLSIDNSVKVAKNYNARVLTEERKGYGSALLKVIQHAKGDIIVLIDGDGSYPIKIVEKALEKMRRNKLDFIAGNRFPLVDYKAMPFVNIVGNYCIKIFNKILFNITFEDVLTGYMIFKKDILNTINIEALGMEFTQEIKIKAWLSAKLRCQEVHIPYYPRIGTSKFRKIRDSIRMIRHAVLLWKKLKYIRLKLD